MKHNLTVDGREKSTRLDLYLVNRLPKNLSRNQIQKLIKNDAVLVNGAVKKNNYRIEEGDFIEIETALSSEKRVIAAENISLNIVYEDNSLLIVNKEAGMVVHPAPGNFTGTLVNALLHHVDRLAQSSNDRPGVVHRLDKDTSGIVIIAKDELAHAHLSRQFSRRTMDKRYMAVVEGVVELDNGIISYPIGRHPRDRKRMAVKFTDSKESVTRYHVLERFKDKTLLELKPETGRTHQIRVHLSYIGHPIVGDRTYGKKRCDLIGRQALHAQSITFEHPESNNNISFSVPLPEDMMNLIEKLKNPS